VQDVRNHASGYQEIQEAITTTAVQKMPMAEVAGQAIKRKNAAKMEP